jgi:hypothetical protein
MLLSEQTGKKAGNVLFFGQRQFDRPKRQHSGRSIEERGF